MELMPWQFEYWLQSRFGINLIARILDNWHWLVQYLHGRILIWSTEYHCRCWFTSHAEASVFCVVDYWWCHYSAALLFSWCLIDPHWTNAAPRRVLTWDRLLIVLLWLIDLIWLYMFIWYRFWFLDITILISTLPQPEFPTEAIWLRTLMGNLLVGG